MTNKEIDLTFLNLVKVEKGIAKIYNAFSLIEHFSNPVKNFWITLAKEEELHADMFDKMRQSFNDNDIQLSLKVDMTKLKEFVDELNVLLKEVDSSDFDEAMAYSFGAIIETKLDEAEFTSMIETNEQKFVKMLKRIEIDTTKHRMILMNHAKGID